MRRTRKPLMELLNQARFADSRLARNQHHLSLAVEHPFPSIPQQPQFLLPADERRQYPPTGMKPAAHTAELDDTIKLDRLRDSLELMRAAILYREHPRHQPMRIRRDKHGVGRGRSLYARGEVGRVAEDVGVGAAAGADHDRAGMDADPGRELWPITPGVECLDRVEDLEPGAHCALGVIVVRLRITEIRHHTVAEKLCDVTAETLHPFGGRALIAGDDLARFLGIELVLHLGRTDQVAEQDRQMAPLALDSR